MFSPDLIVVGGGLAGCEAAWQLAERGLKVSLVEQKPARMSPAHTTLASPAPTSRPFPQSSSQSAGWGGGVHALPEMSQRTVPPPKMQPMLLDGSMKCSGP